MYAGEGYEKRREEVEMANEEGANDLNNGAA